MLCWWEDDGQADEDADDIRGGPNGGLSLAAARENFRDHLTVYPAGRDTRMGGEDSQLEVQAKRTIVSALNRLRTDDDPLSVTELWEQIDAAEAILRSERNRKIRQHEADG